MRIAVFLSVLMVSGWASAEDYRGVFINEECANKKCTKFNVHSLQVVQQNDGYEFKVRKVWKNKTRCEVRAKAELVDGKLVATKKFKQWDNINHMLMTRICRITAVVDGDMAQVYDNGSCEKFCDSGSPRTKELYDVRSFSN